MSNIKRLLTILTILFWSQGQVAAVIGSCEDVECARGALNKLGHELPDYDRYEILIEESK